jgi:type I restriction enzyme M protein
MAHDGFSLDDKRTPVSENDIPDVLSCWQKRQDASFQQARQQRLAALQEQVAPLKAERLKLHGEINRLTFEQVITPESSFARSPSDGGRGELAEAQACLDALEAQIAPLQAEIDQLSRQFWVGREQVKANKYDLSASRYRKVEADEVYYEKPQVTLERLARLEGVMGEEISKLREMID